MENQITTYQHNAITVNSSFDDALFALEYSLSDTSKRKYQHTYQLWKNFADQNGIDAMELTAKNVIRFLDSTNTSHSTKQNRLSHLRKLAQFLAAADDGFKRFYDQLKLLTLKQPDIEKQHDVKGKALAPDEIYDAFRVFSTNTPQHIRNRAILAVLFYAGVRRSELVNLLRTDVDLENGLVTIRHGKGNKARTIPFASNKAIKHLKEWLAILPDDVNVLFPAIRKGGHIQHNKLTTDAIRKITDDANFSPHDARRTLITRMLSSGTSLADAQFIAGHSRGETTMRYAKVKDAKEVKGRVKLDY